MLATSRFKDTAWRAKYTNNFGLDGRLSIPVQAYKQTPMAFEQIAKGLG
jgi:hypothetical protein